MGYWKNKATGAEFDVLETEDKFNPTTEEMEPVNTTFYNEILLHPDDWEKVETPKPEKAKKAEKKEDTDDKPEKAVSKKKEDTELIG